MEDSDCFSQLSRVKRLPVPSQRLFSQSSNFYTYCVKFQSIEGFPSQEEDGAIEHFHLQANLFDQVNKLFLGNSWIGKVHHVKNRNAISLKESFYFYTSIPGNELLLVVEVVTESKVPGKNKTFGWIFQSLLEKPKVTETDAHYKLTLISGTPVILYLKNGEAKIKEHLDLISSQTGDKVELSLSVSNYPPLMRVFQLIPENILFEPSDYVPGLLQESKDRLNEPNYSYKPKLQKCSTHLLEKISVKVYPSIDAAETDILKHLQRLNFEEYSMNHSSNQQVSSNSELAALTELEALAKLEKKNKEVEKKASDPSLNLAKEPMVPVIAHRRIQIGVYNGFCFIHEPDIYHLLMEPVVNPTGYQPNRLSSSLGSLNCREECLILRSDIKIPNVPDDKNIVFVFLVEYGISYQFSNAEKRRLTSPTNSCPNLNVGIAWGFCKLFNLKTNSALNIPLTGNPNLCPFKVPFYNAKHEFAMTLSLVPSRQDKLSSTPADSVQDKMSTSTFSDDSQSTVQPPNIFSSPIINHPIKKPKSMSDIPRNVKVDVGTSKSRQGVSVQQHKDYGANTSLQEVALVPSSIPLVPPTFTNFFGHQGRDSSFPKAYWDSLQPVFDHHGHPATVIDGTSHYGVDQEKEIHCSPQINECSFQFLALSGLENDIQIPSQIFITFQFYRFPPIKSKNLLMTSNLHNRDNQNSAHVYALYNSGDGGRLGYQVTYNLDPCEFGNGEFHRFLLYLAKQRLHLDIWDGESLLYFGTVLVPLKYFCRQGKEAVCSVLELDVIKCEFLDDSLGQTALPTSVSKGKLHVRLANVRHPLPPDSLKKIEEQTYSDAVVIQAKGKISETAMRSSVVSHAKPIAQTNRELSKLLTSRCVLNDANAVESSQLSDERRRKLARMEALRNVENKNSDKRSCGIQSFIKERQRDLRNIESYVKKNKPEMIRNLLHSSVTTEHVIYPTIGETHFFEFELKNPYTLIKTVEIHWKCSDIKLITDAQKWQFLRNKNNMLEKVESRIFNLNNGVFSTVLQPKETVNIPFTYHNVVMDDGGVESFKAASGHNFSAGMLSSAPISNSLRSFVSKIHFQAEDQTVIAVLSLKIQLMPVPFTHVFKFLSAEHSTFKKSIRVSECNSNTQYGIECSDPEVVCSLQEPNEWDSGISVHLQAPTNTSGRCRQFYLFIYSDVYHISLYQAWIVSVSPQRRIDLTSVAGQVSQTSLVIRGSHVTNLVKCFPNSPILQLYPSDPFVLTAFSVQELAMNVRCLAPGTRHFLITMVSQSLEQILQSWLLVLCCQKPSVSKAFQVHLTIGKESTKRITYTNTCNQQKDYVVFSSHPHLVLLRENQFSILPGKSYCLGLYFPLQDTVFTDTVFLYLNDSSDKNEETYCIKVICQ